MKYFKLKDNIVCFVGIRTVELPEPEFISLVQNLALPGVTLQLVNAKSVYGPAHLLGVLKITLECQRRGRTLSQKTQMDLLLRLSFTNQIVSALDRCGLKRYDPAIAILYSTDKNKLARTRHKLTRKITEIDNKVLNPKLENRDYLFRLLGVDKHRRLMEANDNFVIRYLIERSAIVMK